MVRGLVQGPIGSTQQDDRSLLTTDLLGQFTARAQYGLGRSRPGGVALADGLAELHRVGYLTMAVPGEFGGQDFSLPEVVLEQRRLAFWWPALARAVNPHLCWTGTAADQYRSGDQQLGWMLVAAAAGGLFAAGHGEPGQDLTLARPRLRAEPAGGGCYRLSGRQAFAALPPGWTRLGVHALDDSDPAHPQVVHAFLRRDTPGYRIIEAPASGQPASPAARSEPGSAQAASGQPGRLLVSLDRAVARAARVLPAGPPGDPFLGCLLSWMLLSTANISYATGQRAFDQAAQAARQSPLSERGPSSEQGPSSDWTVAEAALELGAIESQLDRLARSRPRPGVHCAAWIPRLFAARHHAVQCARRLTALAGPGGSVPGVAAFGG